jgi:FkbM family methyltransferase
VLHSVAAALARGRRLRLEPGWHFHFPSDDAGQLTLLKRDIWTYYRDSGIARPVVFHWYDRLRVRLYLGNDLSLCLYVLGAFEPNEFVFLSRLLGPGMVVLDGGANEGVYSLYAARLVGRQGAVLAVEPSTREFRRLRANIEMNRLDNVKTFKVALGSQAGEALLAVAASNHAGMNAIERQSSDQPAAAWTESHEAVPVETIDAIVDRCRLQRLDVVKLDVEGSEVDAMDGAHAAIARFQPKILLEAEEARLASQGRTKEDLLRVLTAIGYELWVFDADSAQLRRAELPAEPEGNAIAAPRDWRPPILS